jgi:hypothetical protein
MIQKHRIRTNIGVDKVVNVNIEQKFDQIEILSLKFTQSDVYTSLCADYGVVCGRVSVNNGFGVPNARVSIFVPLDDVDAEDPVISALYPYKTIKDTDENNYRYNLLPSRQQHGGHAPTGTFPDQRDILTREEVLEVFEKYYKYTVKTNSSGDFMIWGVPLGQQSLHVDVDLSDIGCFSLRPDDFIRQGMGVDKFKNTYSYKSSTDLVSLPQIVSFDRTIEVTPFWGNVDLCQIGITRTDFDLSDQGVKIEPKAYILGGTFTNTGRHQVSRKCVPAANMGAKCSLASKEGLIEAIRFTQNRDENNRPILEHYDLHEDIAEDGSYVFSVPMNMDFLYTNEFGENEYTSDPNKGIATSSCYRFRFSLKEGDGNTAAYLAPNIREFTNDVDKSYAWSNKYENYPAQAQSLILNVNNEGFFVPQDYFYRFTYNKVFTVSSFQGSYFNQGFLTRNRYLGIKELKPDVDADCNDSVVTPPINFATKNAYNFKLLLAVILTFIKFVITAISLTVYEFTATLLKSIADALNFKVLGWRPLGRVSEKVRSAAYEVQSGGQFTMPLTIYDDCELCSSDSDSVISGFKDFSSYCKIGELKIKVVPIDITDFLNDAFNIPDFVVLQVENINESTTIGSSAYSLADSAKDKCLTDALDPDYQTYSGCCSSYTLSSNVLSYLNDKTEVDVNGLSLPRFAISVGTNPNSELSEIGAYIGNNAAQNELKFYDNIGQTMINTQLVSPFDQIVQSLMGKSGFIIDTTAWANLTGVENGAKELIATPLKNPIYAYIIDRRAKKSSSSYSGMTIEEGCAMYDTLYNEKNIKSLLWFKTTPTFTANYGDPYVPYVSQPLNDSATQTPGIVEKVLADRTSLKASANKPAGDGWTIGGSVVYKPGQERLPRYRDFSRIGFREYNRKTKTGYTEFRDGVLTLVPSSDGINVFNFKVLNEWYKRQLVGVLFCGGIANFGFIDNWLSGALYFFKFKVKIRRGGTLRRRCYDLVHYDGPSDKFYYRSTPFNNNQWGQRSLFSNKKLLKHPTTFVDLGPRDEFIKEICTDPALDPNCSVSRSIGETSYKSFGELIAFAINYRMDSSNDDHGVNEFFTNGGFKEIAASNIMDGDILQLISINNEAGIRQFDLQDPHYLGYSLSSLDPDDDKSVFQNGSGVYGPTPVTFTYSDDGIRIRQCLNAPGNLTEASQNVPFFLWNKGGFGFGPMNNNLRDDQGWDYENVQVQPLQGMTYGYRYTGGTNDPDDAYLLPPMSYDFTGYTVTGVDLGLPNEFNEVIIPPSGITDDAILEEYRTQPLNFSVLIVTSGTEEDPTTGRLYLRNGDAGHGYTGWTSAISWDTTMDYSIYPTNDPYTTNKQILSTPFMFYFGLRPGKTGLDKFIQRFGPLGAFPSAE